MARPRFSMRWLVIGVVALALVCWVIGVGVLALRSGVTRTNYNRIRIGMTDSEVTAMLGQRPSSNMLMLGRIAGPEAFTQDGQTSWYRYQEWNYPKIIIVTVSDPKTGRVVCRYSGQGTLGRLRQLLPW